MGWAKCIVAHPPKFWVGHGPPCSAPMRQAIVGSRLGGLVTSHAQRH